MNSTTGTVFVLVMFGQSLRKSLYGGAMGWVSVLNKSSFGFENESKLHIILFFCSTKLFISSLEIF